MGSLDFLRLAPQKGMGRSYNQFLKGYEQKIKVGKDIQTQLGQNKPLKKEETDALNTLNKGILRDLEKFYNDFLLF